MDKGYIKRYVIALTAALMVPAAAALAGCGGTQSGSGPETEMAGGAAATASRVGTGASGSIKAAGVTIDSETGSKEVDSSTDMGKDVSSYAKDGSYAHETDGYRFEQAASGSFTYTDEATGKYTTFDENGNITGSGVIRD